MESGQAPTALCRDCLAEGPAIASPRRCPHCGGPRLVDHAERDSLQIAHVDCDAFFAAIEKRDDPSLRDRPVIIGGGRRGVVSTACYLARLHGVRSAMPMFQALRACPDAVVIRPRMEAYAAASREVRRMMGDLTPLVEPISIDEAFLDLTGTRELHKAGPALVLTRFAQRVERELGISVSVGLAPNKFLAKIASDIAKPRGFSVIGRDEALAFLETKPVGILPGVGGVAQERLARAGATRVGDLRRLGEAELVRRVGSDGARLHRLAHGLDARRVEPRRETKSLSAETTFEADLASPDALEPVLMRLCERVALRLRRADLGARSVTLKLKTADFKLRTRARSGLPATRLAPRLFEAARDLLGSELDGATQFRLIGVSAGDLCDPELADQGDLVDRRGPREAGMEAAIDRLRDKFGAGAIERGIVFASRQGGRG